MANSKPPRPARDAADHLATFNWLYPAATFPQSRHLYLAAVSQLEAQAGNREAARASSAELMRILQRDGVRDGRLYDRTRAALADLNGKP